MWSAIEADPRLREFQVGRLAPQQWHEHVAKRFGVALSYDKFCAVWNSSVVSETILDDELFAKLAERYGLALLSNTDPIHVAYLESHFSFFRHFPARIYSCRVGVCKPDAAIYRRAAAAAGVRADEILYIDDIAEYIEAGRRAGMDVHLFRSAESLKEDLRNRGLLGG